MRVAALCVTALAVATGTLWAAPARADAQGVGLGVAAGMDYHRLNDPQTASEDVRSNSSLAWGFFVDIPLLETFYISPATTLYKVSVSDKVERQATDVDLNFKFIVPISSLRLGAGFTVGLSTGLDLDEYKTHWGALGYASLNLVSNLDAFVLVQWKRHDFNDMTVTHGYAGGMFRF